MFVDNIQIETVGENTRVSAEVDGHTLWFQLPTKHFRGSVADALACFSFFPAMARFPDEEPACLSMAEDMPVSSRMLAQFERQQDTFAAWGEPLQRFSIDLAQRNDATPDERVVSSFSGGVDSLYTAVTRADEITHLVHIQGYELRLDQDPESAGIPRLEALAKRLNKELIVVQTNALSVYQEFRIQRLLVFGGFMATVAHLVGAGRFIVPSGAPLRALTNEGSHPYTDPCWSSEGVEIVHDINDLDRIEKMRRVDGFGYLDGVIVCSRDFSSNCCRCLKCVRTMTGIELQGLDSSSFAEPLTTAHIRQLSPLNGKIEREYFGRYLVLAKQLGRYDLVRAMAFAEARHRIFTLLKQIYTLLDELFLGGRVVRAREARGPRPDAPGQRKRNRWFHVVQ